MISYHRRMFAFDHWANRTSLAAVAPHVHALPRSLAWLNHILGAKAIWLARVAGTKSPFPLNPTLDAATLAAELDRVHDEWDQFLAAQTDADLARVIVAPTRSRPIETTLEDVLAHRPVHGQHHRGQVNADLRAAGLAPPVIDYIHSPMRAHGRERP